VSRSALPVSEAGRGSQKAVHVSEVNQRTVAEAATEARPSESELGEAAQQPLNTRLQRDPDLASAELYIFPDSSITKEHAHNRCSSVAYAHNSCSSVAYAQESGDSIKNEKNRYSCGCHSAHAQTPERHVSASSCSSSSSISARGRQEPVTSAFSEGRRWG